MDKKDLAQRTKEFTQKAKDLVSSMDKASELLSRYLDAVKEGKTYRSKYFKKRYDYIEKYIESEFTELANDVGVAQLISYCANDAIATEKAFEACDKPVKEAAHV